MANTPWFGGYNSTSDSHAASDASVPNEVTHENGGSNEQVLHLPSTFEAQATQQVDQGVAVVDPSLPIAPAPDSVSQELWLEPLSGGNLLFPSGESTTFQQQQPQAASQVNIQQPPLTPPHMGGFRERYWPPPWPCLKHTTMYQQLEARCTENPRLDPRTYITYQKLRSLPHHTQAPPPPDFGPPPFNPNQASYPPHPSTLAFPYVPTGPMQPPQPAQWVGNNQFVGDLNLHQHYTNGSSSSSSVAQSMPTFGPTSFIPNQTLYPPLPSPQALRPLPTGPMQPTQWVGDNPIAGDFNPPQHHTNGSPSSSSIAQSMPTNPIGHLNQPSGLDPQPHFSAPLTQPQQQQQQQQQQRQQQILQLEQQIRQQMRQQLRQQVRQQPQPEPRTPPPAQKPTKTPASKDSKPKGITKRTGKHSSSTASRAATVAETAAAAAIIASTPSRPSNITETPTIAANPTVDASTPWYNTTLRPELHTDTTQHGRGRLRGRNAEVRMNEPYNQPPAGRRAGTPFEDEQNQLSSSSSSAQSWQASTTAATIAGEREGVAVRDFAVDAGADAGAGIGGGEVNVSVSTRPTQEISLSIFPMPPSATPQSATQQADEGQADEEMDFL